MDLDTLLLFLSGAFNTYSAMIPNWLIACLAFLGAVHVLLPKVQAIMKMIVDLTPTKKDDVIYEEVTRSKYFLIFAKVVQFVSGLKLPETKKVPKTAEQVK